MEKYINCVEWKMGSIFAIQSGTGIFAVVHGLRFFGENRWNALFFEQNFWERITDVF